ncbi:MAG TPA: U32 family peptidase [Spirochaetota bacterium]|nr:U32 family peptidase [Spirochaetota bacterium]HPC39917.1 U32 family peptidase [Spirochaetota bacterium]HPL18034.1 U32 family peptidase [Spirochaetota bacterium]HQF08907.1 U32 family peptidase [Spirochaetota bacterium]HQH97833.1 U32 family peptidase [Spirochaetota bacterium]
MKFSVACSFDDALLEGLAPYPVYELYGKLTSDYFGGGRPSFYLPSIDKQKCADFVKKTHEKGMEFNYLLNASTMGNMEYTSEGQREINHLLGWLNEIKVDSVTVANVFFLKLIKRRYPNIKVRVSSHRYTDNPRKIRFWKDAGADCIVISEVNIHREFKELEAMRKAAGETVELSLIVNNWCRQDCAIAGNHAVGLSAASQKKSKGFPLDFCSLYCNQMRLAEPVHYIRANWIRPEDLHIYEEMGYVNFKIVERNTPTAILLDRVKAYHDRKYDGNLLYLFQNYAYPLDKFSERDKDAFSRKRLLKYFIRPKAVNLIKFLKVVKFGETGSVLFPLRGANPVYIDNRKLDGFIDFFHKNSCKARDCETCRYCHRWAEKAVQIDPAWKKEMNVIYDELLEEIYSGGFWEGYMDTARKAVSKASPESQAIFGDIKNFSRVLKSMD